ncbi:unnamed protein product [Rotaria sp. Silwood2]|nr:unnamed protein product [Rotaria sp. Silwood2]
MCKLADTLKQTVADNEQKLFETEQKYHKHPRPNEHTNGYTSATMIDKYGNQTTGYNRRLADASRTSRFQSRTSKLKQNNPTVCWVLPRPLNACAEHMVYQSILNPIITYALQLKDGIVKCIKWCQNCDQFDLGSVITDSMDGVPVPFLFIEILAPGSYVGAVVCGTFLITVADRKKDGHR